MSGYTAHVDTFVRENLPPPELWPELRFDRPGLIYPERLNCASALLESWVRSGQGGRTLFRTPHETWTYAGLDAEANRIARVLREDLGVVPGNRVLLFSTNSPRAVACWFAIVKAGAVVCAAMPLLRRRELAEIIDKGRIQVALCDERLVEEMEEARAHAPGCRRVCTFDGSGREGGGAELERLACGKADHFRTVETASDDPVLIAFTSGTTGKPKGTVHFHRDVLAICDCFPPHALRAGAEDVFIGSPPLAFTFGLGGLVLFPMRVGASAVLLERARPPDLLEAIGRFAATVCFTAPAAYRKMLNDMTADGPGSLSRCVSAGETLPLPIFRAWEEATGIRIIDGIGATEMLHIFISSPVEQIRPGATGKPVPGYEARIVDADMAPLPPGEMGHLAVKGPTGCRYLADSRQGSYVRDGWNMTGDIFTADEDGYFWFQSRADDLIVASGYNIAGLEVEEVLLDHPAVAECAVVGARDEAGATIVKAFVVPASGYPGGEDRARELQDHVKAHLAPYKYPRAVAFVDALPRTETGKVQRFKLRE